MNYPESVRYLYALGNELKAGAKFGLERMKDLLSALGNPERGQRLIHVAGTNGKGSTSAMIAAALRQSGFRTGLYTSPHLVDPTERIQIDGENVSREDFGAAFDIVHEAAEALLKDGKMDAHPSYFETVTAMAFLVLQKRAEVTVIEVGLGGRLDATNVILPELCVITPIGYDHEAFLGNTLESIAGEKAGILKSGVPLVMARQEPAAKRVILDCAAALKCPTIQVADMPVHDLEPTAFGSNFRLNEDPYHCPLPGRHQVENAATAILACRRFGLPTSAIQAGLARVRWPGRLERVARNPDFVLDGAHNPAGAQALAAYIQEFCREQPVWIVYGAMRDKAIEEVTEQLFPLAQRLILTSPDMPRALRPEAILQVTGHPNAVSTQNVQQAIEKAREAPRDAVVFFTGSLYVVGEARGLLPNGG